MERSHTDAPETAGTGSPQGLDDMATSAESQTRAAEGGVGDNIDGYRAGDDTASGGHDDLAPSPGGRFEQSEQPIVDGMRSEYASRVVEQRYGGYLSRPVEPVEFESTSEFQQRLREDGVTDRPEQVPGISDADGAHVWRDAKHADHVAVHEELHRCTSPELAGVSRGMCEGITEHLTNKVDAVTVYDYRALPDGDWQSEKIVSYPGNCRIAQQMEALVGEEKLQQAYFRGDVEGLRSEVDARCGSGSFDELCRISDRVHACESGDTPDAQAAAEALEEADAVFKRGT